MEVIKTKLMLNQIQVPSLIHLWDSVINHIETILKEILQQ
jgi:hypothetical protein